MLRAPLPSLRRRVVESLRRRVVRIALLATLMAFGAACVVAPPFVEDVSGRFPAEGAADVSRTAELRVRFSWPFRAVDPAVVQVRANGVPVPVTVFAEGALRTLVVRPVEPLPAGADIRVEVGTDITDQLGRTLEQASSWTFRTGADMSASEHLTWMGVDPAPLWMPANSRPLLRFDRPVRADTLTDNVALEDVYGRPLDSSVDLEPVAQLLDDASARVAVAPAQPLTPGTLYWLRVGAGLRAADGRPVVAERRLLLAIRPVDVTPPSPQARDPQPADRAVDQPLRTTMSVGFDQRMAEDSGPAQRMTLVRTRGTQRVASTTVWTDGRLVLTPSAALEVGEQYRVRVEGLVSADTRLPLGSPLEWTFTTSRDPLRGVPPRLLRVTPAPADGLLDGQAPVVLAFDKPIAPESVTAGVTATAGGRRLTVRTVRNADGRSIEVRGARPWPSGEVLRLHIAASLVDTEGLAVDPGTIEYRIAVDADPPRVLSTDPAEGARDVPPNRSLRWTFSEPVHTGRARVVATSAQAPVAGTLSLENDDWELVWTPATPFLPRLPARVVVDGVADLAGNAGPRLELTFQPGGTPDQTPPRFAGVARAVAVGPDSARLEWEAAEDDATGPCVYDVWVAPAAADFDWTSTPIASTSATSATVGGLASGQVYRLGVRARDQAGNRESNQTIRTVQLPDQGAPVFGGVTSVDTVAGVRVLTVRWAAASDDVTPTSRLRYRLFASEWSRGQDLSRPLVETGFGATSAVLSERRPGVPLTSGRRLFVVVTAVDEAGNTSGTTVEASGVVADTVPPVFGAGRLLASPSVLGAIRVTWESADDDTDARDQLRYRVYMKPTVPESGAEDVFAQVGEVVGATSLDVTGLRFGTSYDFEAECLDRTGNSTRPPRRATAITLRGTPPTFPAGNPQLAASSPRPGVVQLNWRPAADSVTPSTRLVYWIHRGRTAESVFTAPAVAGSQPGETSATLPFVPPGQWFFGVRCQNAEGSIDGNTVTATVDVAAPAVTFADVRSRVFDALPDSTRCSRCHAADGVLSYERLTDPASIRCGQRMVVPQSPETSYLVAKIGGGGTVCAGSRMPLGGLLPAASIDLVRQWILAGAPR